MPTWESLELDGEDPAEDPEVVPLGTPGSTSVHLVGAKAASLGRCARAGLPVLPGFILTTVFDPARLADPAAPGTAHRHLTEILRFAPLVDAGGPQLGDHPVRWGDNGHRALFFPGTDASVHHFDHAGAPEH